MKYEEIVGLSEKDLTKKTKDLTAQIFDSRMKNALGQLANPMTIRQMRRDIARFQTALTAKRAQGSTAAKPAAKKAAKPAARKSKAGAKG